jgi:putative oxidoreductase
VAAAAFILTKLWRWTDVSYGILFLRLVLGGIMAAHGAQKLFGWFDGSGPGGTAAGYRMLGYRAPLVMAFAAGLAEFGGGLFLAADFSPRSRPSGSRS